MIIRRVDSTNDWNFGKGISDYAVETEAIMQNIKSRVLSWVGDCFFAPDEGVDWKSRLDIGQQDLLVQEIKAIILQSFGVVRITEFASTFIGQTRAINITYTIDTIFGQTIQSTISQTIGS